jgi:hypothetical protein
VDPLTIAAVVAAVVLVVLFLGPLRPWAGRHWAALLASAVGAVAGWRLGAYLVGYARLDMPYVPPLMAVIFASALAAGWAPALRNLAKDGKE